MQILIAPLEDFVLGEQSETSTSSAKGATTINVKNNTGFAAHDYLIVGTVGYETAEIVQASAVNTNSTSVTISALKFEHNPDEQVTLLRYNQRKFYRATSQAGSYTHLSTEGSPVEISVDSPEGTEFEDSNGVSTSWYKATYYNSYTSVETNLDDAIASKASDAGHYTTIYKIKDEAGMKNNPFISSELIDRYRAEAESIVDSYLSAVVQTLPLTTVPKIVQNITTIYAAGLVLLKEFGIQGMSSVRNLGQEKLDYALSMLDKISSGILPIVDSAGTEITTGGNRIILSSCSNAYNSDDSRTGDLFNMNDEHFRMTDPDSQFSESKRI